MRGFGVVLLLIGASYFVFPRFNIEHMVFKLFGAYRLQGAIGFMIVGAVLLLLSLRGQKKPDKK